MAFYEFLLPQWGSLVYTVSVSALVFLGLYMLNIIVSVPYPKDIPLLREPVGATRFSLKTRVAYYTNCSSLFSEAYENVSPSFHELQLCDAPM